MEGYDKTSYGEAIADDYDLSWAHRLPVEAASRLLASLAGSAPALELGIGTGLFALPLQALGVKVTGIDASEAMVAKLREKPGGADLPVVLGDMVDVPVEGRFGLVYVTFSTLFMVLSQKEQVRCFRNASARLTDDGVFLVHAQSWMGQGEEVRLKHVGADFLVLNCFKHDPVNQLLTGSHVVLSASGVRLSPMKVRYCSPAELDLMAELAGLELADRWGGWAKEPFTANSPSHVSVYRRA